VWSRVAYAPAIIQSGTPSLRGCIFTVPRLSLWAFYDCTFLFSNETPFLLTTPPPHIWTRSPQPDRAFPSQCEENPFSLTFIGPREVTRERLPPSRPMKRVFFCILSRRCRPPDWLGFSGEQVVTDCGFFLRSRLCKSLPPATVLPPKAH